MIQIINNLIIELFIQFYIVKLMSFRRRAYICICIYACIYTYMYVEINMCLYTNDIENNKYNDRHVHKISQACTGENVSKHMYVTDY